MIRKAMLIAVVLACCVVCTSGDALSTIDTIGTLEYTHPFGTASLSYEECFICNTVCSIWHGSDNFILTTTTAAVNLSSEWDYRISEHGNSFNFTLDRHLCEHCTNKYAGRIKEKLSKVFNESVAEFQKAEQKRRTAKTKLRYDNHISGLTEKIKNEQQKLETLRNELKEFKEIDQ